MSQNFLLDNAVAFMQEQMDTLPDGAAGELEYEMWGKEAVDRMVRYNISSIFLSSLTFSPRCRNR
jgi:hypothetical protein